MRTFTGLIGLLLTVTCSGCVTFEATPLRDDWTASSQILQQDSSGLSVAAQTLNDQTEQSFIGRPARSMGYFPVVLMFENKGQSPFLIRRDSIRLETADGATYEPASVSEVFEGLRWSKGLSAYGLPLAIFPAFIIGSRVGSQNKLLHEDLSRKSFRDMRLHDNPKSYNCLVYFPMEPNKALQLQSSDCWLTIEVARQGGEQESGEVLVYRLVPASN